MDGKNRSFWLTAAGAMLPMAALAESEEAKDRTPLGGNSALIWIICAAVVALIVLGIILKMRRSRKKKQVAQKAVADFKAELQEKRAALAEAQEAPVQTSKAVADEIDDDEDEEEDEEEIKEQVTEEIAAQAEEQKPESEYEVLAETAHDVIPASIDGLQIYRFYPDVVIDPANYDVSSVQLGQPVSFVSIGKNLFAQSRRKIIGRVTKKSLAEKIAARQLDKKPVAAVITDADASDGDLKVTIAFYDDLLKIAEEKGAKMIKLSGTKNEEAQANIVRAKVGDACSASFDRREENGKEDRWKVYTADGYVGVLPEDDYYNDGTLRIVVAEVSTSKKDDRSSIWVYVI